MTSVSTQVDRLREGGRSPIKRRSLRPYLVVSARSTGWSFEPSQNEKHIYCSRLEMKNTSAKCVRVIKYTKEWPKQLPHLTEHCISCSHDLWYLGHNTCRTKGRCGGGGGGGGGGGDKKEKSRDQEREGESVGQDGRGKVGGVEQGI